LAAALQPAFPQGDWYKESTKAVQAYRDALQADESKKWEKLREPILEKLSEDIAKLNGAKDMDNVKFAKVGSKSRLSESQLTRGYSLYIRHGPLKPKVPLSHPPTPRTPIHFRRNICSKSSNAITVIRT
jgi:hypothetical protein